MRRLLRLTCAATLLGATLGADASAALRASRGALPAPLAKSVVLLRGPSSSLALPRALPAIGPTAAAAPESAAAPAVAAPATLTRLQATLESSLSSPGNSPIHWEGLFSGRRNKPNSRGYWKRSLSAATAALTAIALTACVHMPAAFPMRTVQSLPSEVAQRFEPRKTTLVWPAKTETHSFYGVQDVTLTLEGGAWLDVSYFTPGAVQGKTPLIIVFPVIRGDKIGQIIARSLAKGGNRVLLIRNGLDRLAVKWDGTFNNAGDLENEIRFYVSAARGLIDRFDDEALVDPARIGFVGVSMGGISGTALLAAEPRIKRSVLMITGGDVSAILERRGDSGVEGYVKGRLAAGLTPQQLREEFIRDLVSDPVNLAKYVDASGMLFVRAVWDGIIPRSSSLRLWRELGRPERIDIFSGHMTSILFFPYLLGEMNDHFDQWPQARPVTDPNGVAATRPMPRR